MNRPKIYLAGPDVFLAYAEERGRYLKDLAIEAGFEPLWPFDASAKHAPAFAKAHAKAIFHANVAMIQQADCLLANIEPFRGPGMDAGTAWEIGCAWGWGKPVFAYSENGLSYAQRAMPDDPPQLITVGERIVHPVDGMEIENFGMADNLMIACSVRDCIVDISAEAALERARRRMGIAR